MFPIPECYNYQVYTNECEVLLINNILTTVIIAGIITVLLIWWRLKNDSKHS